MTTREPEPESAPATPATRGAVAAGLAVVTWLVVLVAVGVVARLDPSSILSAVSLFVVALVIAPIYAVAPWQPAPGGRVVAWIRANRASVAVAAGLLVVRTLPVAPDPLVGLLDLPFRSAGVLFGVELFYRDLAGPAAGAFLRRFAQWYLELLWLLVLGGLVADAWGWVR